MIIPPNQAKTSLHTPKSPHPIPPRIQSFKPNKADFCASTICPTATLGSNTKSKASLINKGLRLKQAERLHLSKLQYTSANCIQTLPIKNRVGMCGRVRIDTQKNIFIRHNGQNGNKSKAHYTNIMQCGSGWLCPVCSQKINAKRGAEVAKGVDTWTDAGGHVLMMTTTVRHDKDDDLKDLLDGMQKASRLFWGHSAIQSIFKDIGKVGLIKNLEVTYGANGFHPHNHYALFVSQSAEALADYSVSYYLDDDGLACYVSPYIEKQLIKKGRIDDIKTCTLERFLSLFWVRCSVKSGLKKPTISNGLTLQCADNIQSYLTKIDSTKSANIGHEMTNIFSKNSVDHFGLLELASQGSAKAVRLFQTFALAIHGQRQLFWSRGLKKLLGIDDVDDDELLSEDDAKSLTLAEITPDIWQLIIRHKIKNQLLSLAENDHNNGSNTLNKILKFLADEVAQNRQKLSGQVPFDEWQRLNPTKRD